MIVAENVTKTFGTYEALRSLSLNIKSGECVGLLGPNGAGKSTFINIVYGACERSGGGLKVFDLDPQRHASAIKARLGVVPQENALDEDLTVIENLRIFAKFLDLPKLESQSRMNELLTYMALDHKVDAPIRSLSGGMKRRLAFVRALLGNPELLILDEPTTGLDPAVRHLLWQRVNDLRSRGKTILITTHYMHEAEVLCDRVIILAQGRVIDQGSPRDLIAKHAPGFVAAYAGHQNLENTLRTHIPSTWSLYKQQDNWCVRAPALTEVVEFQHRHHLEPTQLRPANLEDVYLLLTGEELSQND